MSEMVESDSARGRPSAKRCTRLETKAPKWERRAGRFRDMDGMQSSNETVVVPRVAAAEREAVARQVQSAGPRSATRVIRAIYRRERLGKRG